jgi:acetyl esterase/lipase
MLYLQCYIFNAISSFPYPFLYYINILEKLTNVTQANISDSMIYIPPTISKGAQEILKSLTTNLPTFVTPSSDDLKGWQELNQQTSSMSMQMSQPIVDSYQPTIRATKLRDVNVLDIKQKDWKDNGKVLIYVHGGEYTILGANSTLGNAAPVANITGLRVISVDYGLAPFSKWNQTTDQVVSVIQALKDQGYSLDNIAMYGDSAGGGLIAGSVLKMRDEGVGLPGALVLWSPWTYFPCHKCADPNNMTVVQCINARSIQFGDHEKHYFLKHESYILCLPRHSDVQSHRR